MQPSTHLLAKDLILSSLLPHCNSPCIFTSPTFSSFRVLQGCHSLKRNLYRYSIVSLSSLLLFPASPSLLTATLVRHIFVPHLLTINRYYLSSKDNVIRLTSFSRQAQFTRHSPSSNPASCFLSARLPSAFFHKHRTVKVPHSAHDTPLLIADVKHLFRHTLSTHPLITMPHEGCSARVWAHPRRIMCRLWPHRISSTFLGMSLSKFFSVSYLCLCLCLC
ncbi:hypothetical protein GGI42DRAFT_282232 [Trichoderma sp. SZMC 28013]